MKMPATQWEERFATHITNNGLVLKIQNEFLNIIKTKQNRKHNRKMGKRLEPAFS